jgi:hypothetical protein
MKKIKYLNDLHQLDTPCPFNKKISKDVNITVLAGSNHCIECKEYKRSNLKGFMFCGGRNV